MPVVVKRMSDNTLHVFPFVGPQSKVGDLKKLLVAGPAKPAHPRGTRLIFNGKVLKSKWKLKHYKIEDGNEILMDDRKNWSSDSSSSSSETD